MTAKKGGAYKWGYCHCDFQTQNAKSKHMREAHEIHLLDSKFYNLNLN